MEGGGTSFSEQEKRNILAEAIKASSMSIEKLLAVHVENNIHPHWLQMVLPHGRNMQSCMDTYHSLRSNVQYSPYPNLPPPIVSNKRKSTEFLEPMTTALSPKRRQSGSENMLSSGRNIQPKPVSSNGSPLPFSSHPGLLPAPAKKRGRPSKATVELRQQEAIARGDILPQRVLTPKVQTHPAGEEPSRATYTVIAPMAPMAPMAVSGPPAEAMSGRQYEPSPAGTYHPITGAQYQPEAVMGASYQPESAMGRQYQPDPSIGRHQPKSGFGRQQQPEAITMGDSPGKRRRARAPARPRVGKISDILESEPDGEQMGPRQPGKSSFSAVKSLASQPQQISELLAPSSFSGDSQRPQMIQPSRPGEPRSDSPAIVQPAQITPNQSPKVEDTPVGLNPKSDNRVL